jgi:hypothetical protein
VPPQGKPHMVAPFECILQPDVSQGIAQQSRDHTVRRLGYGRRPRATDRTCPHLVGPLGNMLFLAVSTTPRFPSASQGRACRAWSQSLPSPTSTAPVCLSSGAWEADAHPPKVVSMLKPTGRHSIWDRGHRALVMLSPFDNRSEKVRFPWKYQYKVRRSSKPNGFPCGAGRRKEKHIR